MRTKVENQNFNPAICPNCGSGLGYDPIEGHYGPKLVDYVFPNDKTDPRPFFGYDCDCGYSWTVYYTPDEIDILDGIE